MGGIEAILMLSLRFPKHGGVYFGLSVVILTTVSVGYRHRPKSATSVTAVTVLGRARRSSGGIPRPERLVDELNESSHSLTYLFTSLVLGT